MQIVAINHQQTIRFRYNWMLKSIQVIRVFWMAVLGKAIQAGAVLADHSEPSQSADESESQDIGTTFAEDVWNDFFPRLADFARRKLRVVPRRDFDEEDVALSAINSFFEGYKDGRFKIEERDDLWRLLATIAARKASKHQRKYFTQKRGSGNVRGDSVFQGPGDTRGIGGIEQVQDSNPMPELTEHIFATCEDLLSALNNDKLRTTAVMRMQGFSNAEISEHLNCSVARTKQRIAMIKAQWESELGTKGQ